MTLHVSGFIGWKPYYPTDYPIRDGIHNPWVVIDPISGMCSYDVWIAMRKGSPHNPSSKNLPVTEQQLRDKLAEIRSR